MNQVADSYFRLANLISRLFYLNILWTVFTLLGLVVFGITPATVASYTVIRKQRDNPDLAIFPLFWQSYKDEFVKSNKFGIVVVLFIYIQLSLLYILSNYSGLAASTARIIAIMSVLYLWTFMMYFLPIYVYFDLDNIMQYVRWAFLLSLRFIIMSALMLIIALVANYLMGTYIPIIYLILGMTLNFYINYRIVSPSLVDFEIKEEVLES